MLYQILLLTIIFLLPQLAWAKLDVESLGKQITQSSKNFNGRLGVGIIDVQTGESWYLNGDKSFLMQSVVKVPVAIAALRRVDEGKLGLPQEIQLTKTQVSKIRNATIPDSLSPEAKTTKLSYLIERSICRSNNGAVDVLTKILGGPAAINAIFKDAHISKIRVDSYEAEASLRTAKNDGSDLQDSATPRAMCDLLYKLETGKLLSAQSTAYLLDLTRHCETGTHRIPAGFPKDWTVAHKTGTGPEINGVNIATNDVAVITSPNKSCFILTTFVADSKMKLPKCENEIANIARALYLSAR